MIFFYPMWRLENFPGGDAGYSCPSNKFFVNETLITFNGN
jgi:hypothetical protein